MSQIEPLVSDAPLIVYIDVKSPYAFVAIRPTIALERSLGMQFDWRPLTLDIPSYLGSARKEGGKVVQSSRSSAQWNSVKYAYRDTRRYAELQGYMLKGTEKIWDSSIANIGILWVVARDRSRLASYLDEVYPPFWRRQLDIEDVQVVANCLSRAGVSTEGFDAFQRGQGRIVHDQLQNQLHDHGIYGVPTYIISEKIAAGKTLFGREHLPLIRWYLTGSQGRAPDIAYEF